MGGNEVSSQTVTYGQSYETLPTPTKEGYTFGGWYNVTDVGTVSLNAIADGTPSSNAVHCSILDKVEANVTYTISMDSAVLNSGTATNFMTLIYDYTAGADLSDWIITDLGRSLGGKMSSGGRLSVPTFNADFIIDKMNSLMHDVGSIREDVGDLKGDVSTLKSDVASISGVMRTKHCGCILSRDCYRKVPQTG